MLINIRKETENDCNDIKSVNDKVISQKSEYEALSLAPMSVLPNYQKIGIGSKLIEHGIKAAKKAGYDSIIVLGHSDYYPRFGFVPASNFGIKPPFEVPDTAFMGLELLSNSLKGKEGKVKYPKEYNAGIDCEDLL